MNICKVAAKHAAFQPSELRPSSKTRVFIPMATRALSRRLRSLSRSAERKILLYQQWFCRLRTAKLETPDTQAALRTGPAPFRAAQTKGTTGKTDGPKSFQGLLPCLALPVSCGQTGWLPQG
jgi:hypothetical protein